MKHDNSWHVGTGLAKPSYVMRDNTVIAFCIGSADEENARRIVACVNACAGIDTQVLLDDPGFIKDALYRLQSLGD